jgi:hypothetical protein
LTGAAAAFLAMQRRKGDTMKLAIGAAAMALVLAGFAFAAGIDGGGDDRGRTSSATTSTTTGATTTDDRFDDRNRRGHGAKKAKLRRKNARVRGDRVREPGEDVRGPCDEAEHANDPRCTGAAVHDDRRGRDGDNSGRGRSGSNSGPG